MSQATARWPRPSWCPSLHDPRRLWVTRRLARVRGRYMLDSHVQGTRSWRPATATRSRKARSRRSGPAMGAGRCDDPARGPRGRAAWRPRLVARAEDRRAPGSATAPSGAAGPALRSMRPVHSVVVAAVGGADGDPGAADGRGGGHRVVPFGGRWCDAIDHDRAAAVIPRPGAIWRLPATIRRLSGDSTPGSAADAVEVLQEVVRRELDLLVAPLGGAVDARDQPAAVDPAEVAVDERVARLGLLRGALRQPEEPAAVVLPAVVLEVRVLRVRLGLRRRPSRCAARTAARRSAPAPGHGGRVHARSSPCREPYRGWPVPCDWSGVLPMALEGRSQCRVGCRP